MTDMWYAGDRATKPPVVELNREEDRYIPIALAPTLQSGETIATSPAMVARVREYRTKDDVDPTALSAPLNYSSGTKTVSQKIDASKLPFGVPCVLEIDYTVNGVSGIERRSIWLVLRVVS